MIGVAAASQADQTVQAVSALIVLLLVVAGLLTLLTIWYWFHTSPRRRARRMSMVAPGVQEADQVAYEGASDLFVDVPSGPPDTWE